MGRRQADTPWGAVVGSRALPRLLGALRPQPCPQVLPECTWAWTCRWSSVGADPSPPLHFMGLPCLPAYVLPVKVEMGLLIQQYEKAKVIQDDQLERLTQLCQEQGVRRGVFCFCPLLSRAEDTAGT